MGGLKSRFGVRHTHEFGVAANDHRSLHSGHPVIESVRNATAVVAHGDDLLTDADRPHPVFHAALENDVPIIIESPSAELLAKIVGVGMAADAAMITTRPARTTLDGTAMPTVHVTLIQHEAESDFPAADEDDGALQSPSELELDYQILPSDVVDGPEVVELDAGAAQLDEAAADSASTVADLIDRLEALRDAEATPGVGKTRTRSQAYPGHWQSSGVRAENSKWIANVEVVTKSWRPAAEFSGKASIGLVFTASLFDSVAPDAKYCLIQVHGTGVQTGMYSDETWFRGYFNERFAFDMEPAGSALVIDKHAPLNSNHDTQIQVSTGLSVQASKDGPQVSYQSSEQTSLSYPDFEVLDESGGRRARWVYRLYTVEGGHRYNQPSDLIKTVSPQLRELPQYARGNIPIQCEATWLAAGDFAGKVTFNYTFRHSVATVWRPQYDLAPCAVTCPLSMRFKIDQKSVRVKGKFVIDFGRVHHGSAAEADE